VRLYVNVEPSRFEIILARAEAVAAFGWKAARVVWVCVQLTLLLAIVVLLVWVAQLVIELVGMIRSIPGAVWDMMPSTDGLWPFGDDPDAPAEGEDGAREDKPPLLERFWPFGSDEE